MQPWWFLLLGVLISVEAVPHCVTYGLCHSTGGGNFQSCVYNGPPKELTNATALKILKERCPTLYPDTGPVTVCCDADQVLNLEDKYHLMEPVFKRCPSCISNIAQQMCFFSCSPKQSEFLKVQETALDDITLNKYVTTMEGYASPNYMDKSFRSCSQVVLPSLGKHALDASCGSYTAEECTPERWFSYLGDPDKNPYAPMRIIMRRTEDPILDYKPFDPPTYECYESPVNGTPPCSCLDCLHSCPAPHHYPGTDMTFFVLGMDGYAFIMAVVYVLIIIIIAVARILGSKYKQLMKNRTVDISSHFTIQHKKPSYVDRLNDRVEGDLEHFFASFGKMIGDHPTLVLAVSSWMIGVCCYGAIYLDITTDPVQIWASPNSQSRIEKDYFESRFEPFYRSEQIFIKAVGLPNIKHNTPDGELEFGPIFNKEFLLKVLDLQTEIEKLPGLEKICFAPLSKNGTAQTKDQCTVQSIWGYFQNDIDLFNQTYVKDNFTINYLNRMHDCLQNSLSTDCLAPYGGNVEPAIGVGGFLKHGETAYEKANSLVVTYLINNHLDQEKLQPALDWEKKWIDFMKNWTLHSQPSFMDVAYKAERSIEDELNRESIAEASTVIISYVLMFLYISIALGSYTSFKTLLIESKVGLGLGGVGLVLASVFSSLGIFGYAQVPTTLLTVEVIPFLVLAVGVDNMFILVATNHRNRDFKRTPGENVSKTLGQVGPSLLLTTLSEAACFSIGCLTDMPAVKTFAMYGTVALLINFFLQMTAFIAFLSINIRRVSENRLDILCCVSLRREVEAKSSESLVYTFMEKKLVPLIFTPILSIIILLLFIAWFCISIATIPHIEPGLEQQLSMPEDSYVNKYFEYMKDVLSMGPPVYFVIKSGLNYSDYKTQNVICGGLFCNSDSLSTQIFRASRQENVTYLARPASSWLDDYYDWASISSCCKMYKNGTFCPHNDVSGECISCDIQLMESGRPDPQSFRTYLPFFLQDNPDPLCAKGGHAAYYQGLNYDLDEYGYTDVTDSYFMSFHRTLVTSKDYYTALRMARTVAENITSMIKATNPNNAGIEVFAYSVFYVFYEQYLGIWAQTTQSLCFSILAVFFVTFIFTGFDILSSLIVVLTVTMIVVNLAGLMYWWDINLNAITLVNLVMAVGISVEFCSHIVHSFNLSSKATRSLRSQDALLNTGTSVLSGITLTKFIGIGVLGFSKTQIFRVFYFRMYLGMVLFGSIHGLIFLPILLRYVGADNKGRRELRLKRSGLLEEEEDTLTSL